MRVDRCFNPRKFSRQEVTKALLGIKKVLKGKSIKLAYLAGSILEDNLGTLSDVDIAVLPRENVNSFDLYGDLYFDLCRVLGGDNIDLIHLREAPVTLRFHVAKAGRMIYSSDPEITASFIEDTFRDYYDWLPFKKEESHCLHEIIKKEPMKRTINKDKIDLYLKNLVNSVEKLKKIKERFVDLEEFMAKEDDRALVEHYLRLAFEAVIDICRHIVAAKQFRLQGENSTSFIDTCGREGVIPSDFARHIRGMAGMRNVLVHLYWNMNIDYKMLYDVLDQRLDNFAQFARYIVEFIEEEDNS